MNIDTKIVAILNITPDSFSDGGKYATPDAALNAIDAYCNVGADIIDIGAESTRPGATPLTPEEEWQRLEPIITALPSFKKAVSFSLDTRYAATAAKAIACGIDWINDVSGFTQPEMIAAVKSSPCKLVMMHSLSVPADKNVVFWDSADVIYELMEFTQQRIDALLTLGIERNRIIFDPGIGFGKTAAQSMTILRNIGKFESLGVPLLVGHSRKSFLSGISANRDEATLTVSHYLAQQGVAYIRVHDAAAHVRMLTLLKALHNE